MPVLQHAEEDFLHQVLADRAVRGEVQKVAKQRPVVPVEKQFQFSDVASPDVQHYLFVFHLPPLT
jgi:hypothetical protein